MNFVIRIGGTNDYVSKIDPDDPRCYPPGSVETVQGRKGAIEFDTQEEAEEASRLVFEIEGFHNEVEPN